MIRARDEKGHGHVHARDRDFAAFLSCSLFAQWNLY